MTMTEWVAQRPVAAAMDDPVATLSARWYNSVVRQLSLSSKTFMLQQPCIPLPLTTCGIWSLFNVIPTPSLVNDIMSGGADRFYARYCDVVNKMNPRASVDMREVLGEDLASWNAYVKGLRPLPRSSELGEVFFSWATINCPAKAAVGRAAFNSLLNDPVNAAVAAMTDTSRFVDGVPNFGITVADALAVLRNSPSATIDFDSAKERSDVAMTWAFGSMSGLTDADRMLVGRDGDAMWRKINDKASKSQVIVEASFEGIATVQGPPGGWCDPAMLSMARRADDEASMWRGPGAGRAAGRPTGDLRWIISSLVLVEGIRVKTTSTAQYSTEEQRQLHESFGGGIWPFTGIDGHGGMSARLKFDKDGAAVFLATTARDAAYVFGANVRPVCAGVDGAWMARARPASHRR